MNPNKTPATRSKGRKTDRRNPRWLHEQNVDLMQSFDGTQASLIPVATRTGHTVRGCENQVYRLRKAEEEAKKRLAAEATVPPDEPARVVMRPHPPTVAGDPALPTPPQPVRVWEAPVVTSGAGTTPPPRAAPAAAAARCRLVLEIEVDGTGADAVDAVAALRGRIGRQRVRVDSDYGAATARVVTVHEAAA